MKTEKTKVEGSMYVFATTKPDWELDNLEPGDLPFYYEIKSYDYGDERSVRIHEQNVIVTIPSGIDVTLACIDNLKEQIEVVRKEAEEKVENLEKRIRALALIEYQPEEDYA